MNRAEIRTQAYLSISYVARMTAVTDTVVKHYESGTLLKSLPHGASAESLEKRLDAFYAWIGEMPR
jgi:predicted transcriptional regulator